MQLSKRLEMLIRLAGTGERAADIGTDHGMVPIELVRRGAFFRALASDVRKGPLAAADAHVREAGLAERITLRLGDGLKVLSPGEADVILISGMGGALMRRLLRDGEAAAKAARRLVLSPQSEIPEFRSFLQKNGYRITDEEIVFEDGKYYFLICAEPGMQEIWTGPERLYGKHLLNKGGVTLKAFLSHRITVMEEILRNLEKAETPKAERKRRETLEEITLAEEAQRTLRDHEQNIRI